MSIQVERDSKKRKRFERDLDPPAIEVTDRDDQVLKLLAEYRYLRTNHIEDLTGRSRRTLNRRLHLLFHNRYVERVRPDKEIGARENADMIYAIGRAGARRLRDVGEWNRPLPESHDPSDRNLTHDLLTIDVLVRIRLACERSQGRVRFISTAEILANSKLRDDKRAPLLLIAPVDGREHHTLPDALFGFEFEDRTKMHLFLEADRGTMPGKRNKKISRGKRLTDLEHKYIVYDAYRRLYSRENAHAQREFPFRFFKVVLVTTNESRANNVATKLRNLVPPNPGERPGMRGWLFSHKAAVLDPSVDFFDVEWLNGQGDYHRLTQK